MFHQINTPPHHIDHIQSRGPSPTRHSLSRATRGGRTPCPRRACKPPVLTRMGDRDRFVSFDPASCPEQFGRPLSLSTWTNPQTNAAPRCAHSPRGCLRICTTGRTPLARANTKHSPDLGLQYRYTPSTGTHRSPAPSTGSCGSGSGREGEALGRVEMIRVRVVADWGHRGCMRRA